MFVDLPMTLLQSYALFSVEDISKTGNDFLDGGRPALVRYLCCDVSFCNNPCDSCYKVTVFFSTDNFRRKI